MQNQHHHVFLIYNKDDKLIVNELAHILTEQDINPWLDSWNLIPGEPFQEAIEVAISQCDTCAILVGASGMGPWQHAQISAAIDRQIRSRGSGFRVIPVFLPHVKQIDNQALPSYASRNTPVEFRESIKDQDALHQLLSGIRGVEPPRGPRDPNFGSIPPYRGLAAFDVNDAPYFFGREALIEELIEMLRPLGNQGSEKRLLGIVGPSGSGKSSLARAGLIASLKTGNIVGSNTWPVAICTPGSNPVESLVIKIGSLNNNQDVTPILNNIHNMKIHENTLDLMTKLLLQDYSPSGRFVLVIDQFEEIFTLCTDDKLRLAAVNNILYAANVLDGKTIVIIVLRADFYGKCTSFPKLANIMPGQHKLVGRMTDEEYRRAIELPAERKGTFFQPGLADVLINDIRNQPGGLPLLQDALLELWNKRKGSMLTHEAYNEIQGIAGALNKRADEIYEKFTAEEKRICRQIFLRLIEPGEDTEDSKRPATLKELIPSSSRADAYQRVLYKLCSSEARLLTIESPTNPHQSLQGLTQDELSRVELSHEALIRSWQLLQSWINENRQALRILRRLREASKEWEQSKKTEELLYHGLRLAEAKDLMANNQDLEITDLERKFFAASLTAEEQINLEKARRVAERRYAARLKKFLILVVVLAVVTSIASVLAFQNWRYADQANGENIALAYASEAQVEISRQPEKALLFALASTSNNSSIRSSVFYHALYDAFDSALIRKILREGDGVTSVAWSPDGTQILMGSLDHIARIFDAASGKQIREFSGHTDEITSVAWSPDATQIATGSLDSTARIWDVASGQTEHMLVGHSYGVRVVAWSPDGNEILTGSDDWTVRIWNTKTATVIQILTGHGDGVRAAAWSPDGQQIVTGSADRTARIWNVQTGDVVSTLTGHSDIVTSVAWSPDGQEILTGSLDKTAQVWSISGISLIHTLAGHQFGITSVAWSPDGQELLTGSLDNTIKIWSFSNGIPIRTLTGYTNGVTSVAWSVNGSQIVGASLDRTVRVWNTSSSAIAHVFSGYQRAIKVVAWSPDGKYLLTGSLDKTVYIWDATKWIVANILQDHLGVITGAAWSPDGHQFITISESENTAKIWEIGNNAPIATLVGHTGDVRSVAWSPDGRSIITGSDDLTARIWNAQDGTTTQLLKDPTSGIIATAWSPNGTQVVTADLDNTVRIWDIATGRETKRLQGNLLKVTSLAWSPDGQFIVSGGDDKTLHVWNVSDGTEVHTLVGHTAGITSVAWSPDGQFIASGGGDNTLRVWDMTDGTEVRTLTEHTSSITSVAWSPDGRYIATGSLDKSAILWYVDRQFVIHSITQQLCEIYENDDVIIQNELVSWKWPGCNTG